VVGDGGGSVIDFEENTRYVEFPIREKQYS